MLGQVNMPANRFVFTDDFSRKLLSRSDDDTADEDNDRNRIDGGKA